MQQRTHGIAFRARVCPKQEAIPVSLAQTRCLSALPPMTIKHSRHAIYCKAAHKSAFILCLGSRYGSQHLRLVRKLSSRMVLSPPQNVAAHCYCSSAGSAALMHSVVMIGLFDGVGSAGYGIDVISPAQACWTPVHTSLIRTQPHLCRAGLW